MHCPFISPFNHSSKKSSIFLFPVTSIFSNISKWCNWYIIHMYRFVDISFVLKIWNFKIQNIFNKKEIKENCSHVVLNAQLLSAYVITSSFIKSSPGKKYHISHMFLVVHLSPWNINVFDNWSIYGFLNGLGMCIRIFEVNNIYKWNIVPIFFIIWYSWTRLVFLYPPCSFLTCASWSLCA